MDVAILTVRGVEFLVPAQYLERLQARRWTLRQGYAVSGKVSLQMWIGQAVGWDLTDRLVDHINGDPRDNRLSNLRPATYQQNAVNRAMGRNNTSGFRGVTWDEGHKRWRAQIGFNYKKLKLGRFRTREEASAAYEAAAKRLFGEFVRDPAYLQIDTSWKDTTALPPPTSTFDRRKPRGGGVTWEPVAQRWIARGYLGGQGGKKYKHLGKFRTKEEALTARKNWEKEHYKTPVADPVADP